MDAEDEQASVCYVCATPIPNEPRIACPCCHVPHHEDCWDYIWTCSTSGCDGKSPGEPPPEVDYRALARETLRRPKPPTSDQLAAIAELRFLLEGDDSIDPDGFRHDPRYSSLIEIADLHGLNWRPNGL